MKLDQFVGNALRLYLSARIWPARVISAVRSLGSDQGTRGARRRRGIGAACSLLRCRVDLVERLRCEEYFIDKPARRFPITSGDGQLALARYGHDAVDTVGEFEVRCVRLEAGLPPQFGCLGENGLVEFGTGGVGGDGFAVSLASGDNGAMSPVSRVPRSRRQSSGRYLAQGWGSGSRLSIGYDHVQVILQG